MTAFADSAACLSRAHCVTCRDRDGGRSWRVSLGRAFTLPQLTIDFDCPYGVPWGIPAPPRPPAAPPATGTPSPASSHSPERIAALRALWAELHTCVRPSSEWMASFTARVPCGECRGHWQELLTTMPPDYSSPAAFWRWSVDAHNAVNRRIGKPEITRESAYEIWREKLPLASGGAAVEGCGTCG